jgi:ATP adenylyltransferase
MTRLSTQPREGGTCAMCSALVSEMAQSWNEPVHESENFVVMTSLGSLVEGWLLIVPRIHTLSAGALPAVLSEELRSVKARVCEMLTAGYGPVNFFEHGPSECRHTTGCGVDHAHVHAVPGIEDLLGAAVPFLPPSARFRPGDINDCREAIAKGLDYLYLEQPNGDPWIATAGNFGSQTFRKAIAARLGLPDRYDWKVFPELRNIDLTKARLGRCCALQEAALA